MEVGLGLGLMAVLLPGTSTAAEGKVEVTLVRDGESVATIVVAKKPTRVAHSWPQLKTGKEGC